MRMPFPKTAVRQDYTNCQQGELYNGNGKRVRYNGGDGSPDCYDNTNLNYRWFWAALFPPWSNNNDVEFLGASVTSSPPTLSAFEYDSGLGIKDLLIDGQSYIWVSFHNGVSKFTPIHPLKVFNQQGRTIVIIDIYKDLYQQDEVGQFAVDVDINGRIIYGAAIKLTGNKYFKAAALKFSPKRTGTTLKQVEDMVKSIRF